MNRVSGNTHSFKYCLVLITMLFCGQVGATQTDTLSFHGHKFYQISSDSASRLMIFLHGGVTNPEFKSEVMAPLEFLLEGNDAFINVAREYGFDLLIPVTDDSLNWLSNYRGCLNVLQDYLDSNKKAYSLTYISGFSDGGTGSYKMFYDSVSHFDGLMVFNGYPQHRNAYRAVDYSKHVKEKVIFASTLKDNVIPYEFLLTEYVKQKRINPETYLYVIEGGHHFDAYGKTELQVLFGLIDLQSGNTATEPVHGFVKNDTVVAFYPFRKKIYRRYGYGKEFLKTNRLQKKLYGKL